MQAAAAGAGRDDEGSGSSASLTLPSSEELEQSISHLSHTHARTLPLEEMVDVCVTFESLCSSDENLLTLSL